MKKVLFIVLSAICILTSCKKDDAEPTKDSGLIIKSGYTGGWGYAESIEISGTTIKYELMSGLSDQKVTKTRELSETERTELMNDVNTDEFIKLDYNECNRCADGTDEFISINSAKTLHQITYNPGLKINSISNLQARLANLMAEFKK